MSRGGFRSFLHAFRKATLAGAAAVAGVALYAQCQPSIAYCEIAPALNPNEWMPLKLVRKEYLTHNTNLYRFALPNPNQVVGLPVASCLVCRAPIGAEKEDGSRSFVIRPYTPVSPKDAKGYFDLVVKVYPEGKFTPYLEDLKLGETVDIKGPIMKLAYTENMKKHIGMVAGGTGITPMYQVLEEIFVNPRDTTQVSLVFANVSENDIICKDQIDGWAAQHPNFKVYYVVDKVGEGSRWQGGVGYLTKDMLRDHLPPPGPDTLVLVCGPPPMMKFISGSKAKDKSQGELTGLLKELSYSADMVYKF